jgi:hypothetical protein
MVLTFARATRQPRLNPQKANWFRPGDLPEPLDSPHFPPIIEVLSSMGPLPECHFGSALPPVSGVLGCGAVLISTRF